MKKSFLFLILSQFILCASCIASKDEWDVHAADRHTEAFGKQVAQKYKMKFLNKGVGSVVDSKKVAHDISIMADRHWTIDQARPVITAIMNEFWHKVATDPVFARDAQELQRITKYYDPVLTPSRIGLRLAFWDKDVNRPLPPYVCLVIVSEGQIRYYTANPKDQSLQPPYIEPLVINQP
jgi:hypothetical protein